MGHISGTSGGMRDSHWGRPGVVPGTRHVPRWPNARQRYLGKLWESGAPPWSHWVALPRDLDLYRWGMWPLPTQRSGAVAVRPKSTRVFEVAFYSLKNFGPSMAGPATRQDRQRKLRLNVFSPSLL